MAGIEGEEEVNLIKSALEKWKLGHVWKTFEDQKLTDVNLISQLTDTQIEGLFNTIGEAAQFKQHWKIFWAKYTKSVEKENPSEEEKDDLVLSCVLLAKINDGFIKNIIVSNYYSKKLYEYNHRGKVLKNKHRCRIAEVIVGDCLLISEKGWSYPHFRKIAECLCNVLYDEDVDNWYEPPIPMSKSKIGKSVPAKGKITDKFKNVMYNSNKLEGRVKKRKKDQKNKNAKKIRLEDTPEPVKISLDWLQKNVGPLELLIKNWRNTVGYRRNWLLKNPRPEVEVVFKDWPILKSPVAADLIDVDFEHLALTEVTLTEKNWEQFFSVVLREQESKIQRNKTAIDLLNLMSSATITTDGRVVAQLSLLAHLITQKGAVSKGALKGRSIPEVQDNLITTVATTGAIVDVQTKKITETGRLIIQPSIIVVAADPEKPSDFFVSIKDQTYPVKSALRALDLSFKFYHVLDGHYPSATYAIWLLIQRGLYNFRVTGETGVPNLNPLLKKLKNEKLQEVAAAKQG